MLKRVSEKRKQDEATVVEKQCSQKAELCFPAHYNYWQTEAPGSSLGLCQNAC